MIRRDDGRDLLIGVIASIVFAGGAAVAAKLDTQVPLWAILLLLFPVAFTAQRLVRSEMSARKRMFLILPAFEHKNWFSQLVFHLTRVLSRAGYTLVVATPIQDYDTASFASLLSQFVRDRHSYAGGFIVCPDPSGLEVELSALSGELARPVVFLDVEPFDSLRDLPEHTGFVGYNAEDIGEQAAEMLINAHEDQLPTRPLSHVLVIGARSQRSRQKGFARRVRELSPDTEVQVLEDGDFARERATRVCREALSRATQQNVTYDAIFATNDEMALGVLDSLSQLRRAGSRTMVFGVDATPEAVALVRSAGSKFSGTIRQDAGKVASEAFHLFELLSKGQNANRIRYLQSDVVKE